MKNFAVATVCLFAVTVFAVCCYAGVGFAPSIGQLPLTKTVPKASKAECKSIAAGNASTVSFDVSTTTMVDWKAITTPQNSTAVIVKRRLNSNTDFMPNSSEAALPVEVLATSLVFGKFSTAGGAETPYICVDKN